MKKFTRLERRLYALLTFEYQTKETLFVKLYAEKKRKPTLGKIVITHLISKMRKKGAHIITRWKKGYCLNRRKSRAYLQTIEYNAIFEEIYSRRKHGDEE